MSVVRRRRGRSAGGLRSTRYGRVRRRRSRQEHHQGGERGERGDLVEHRLGVDALVEQRDEPRHRAAHHVRRTGRPAATSSPGRRDGRGPGWLRRPAAVEQAPDERGDREQDDQRDADQSGPGVQRIDQRPWSNRTNHHQAPRTPVRAATTYSWGHSVASSVIGCDDFSAPGPSASPFGRRRIGRDAGNGPGQRPLSVRLHRVQRGAARPGRDETPVLATDGRYVTQAAQQSPDAEIGHRTRVRAPPGRPRRRRRRAAAGFREPRRDRRRLPLWSAGGSERRIRPGCGHGRSAARGQGCGRDRAAEAGLRGRRRRAAGPRRGGGLRPGRPRRRSAASSSHGCSTTAPTGCRSRPSWRRAPNSAIPHHRPTDAVLGGGRLREDRLRCPGRAATTPT